MERRLRGWDRNVEPQLWWWRGGKGGYDRSHGGRVENLGLKQALGETLQEKDNGGAPMKQILRIGPFV